MNKGGQMYHPYNYSEAVGVKDKLVTVFLSHRYGNKYANIIPYYE